MALGDIFVTLTVLLCLTFRQYIIILYIITELVCVSSDGILTPNINVTLIFNDFRIIQ